MEVRQAVRYLGSLDVLAPSSVQSPGKSVTVAQFLMMAGLPLAPSSQRTSPAGATMMSPSAGSGRPRWPTQAPRAGRGSRETQAHLYAGHRRMPNGLLRICYVAGQVATDALDRRYHRH